MSGVWKRIVVLPLCICLLSACGTARNQVLSVSVSETERLRDLLSRKRIDASFADGTHMDGRVQEVQDGLLTVDMKESTGPSSVPIGRLQGIPTDRISTVRFTQHKGHKRGLFTILFGLGGVGLGWLFAEAGHGSSWSKFDQNVMAGTTVGAGVFGYFLGRQKDKENVTVEIQQPDASGGPLNSPRGGSK